MPETQMTRQILRIVGWVSSSVYTNRTYTVLTMMLIYDMFDDIVMSVLLVVFTEWTFKAFLKLLSLGNLWFLYWLLLLNLGNAAMYLTVSLILG
jgi:hypothetical protein